MKNEIIAYCSICNNFGIGIVKISDEEVHWKYTNEDKVRKSKLKVNKMDKFVFRCGTVWYSLEDFIRVGI